MSSRPFESPPPYRLDEYKPSHYAPSNYAPASHYAPSRDMYGGDVRSQPAYSYYPEDELQHFYKWTSPPGVIRIMAIFIVVLSIGIFACVASTLAWDMDFAGSGMGGFPAYGGSSGFSGYGAGSSNYGYNFAYGGNYTDPRAAKGFMIAMAAFCFISAMVIFVMTVTRTDSARSRKFFLILIIVSAVLGILVFIATIVYIIGVNPTAQASGSVFYTQIVTICQQYYAPTNTGVFVNQYLYHYCVVEPQESIAMVMGLLIVLAFALIIFFSVKTRKKINECGKVNILWEKQRILEEGDPNVEEWVKNVSSDPERIPPLTDYVDPVNGSAQNYNPVNGVMAYPTPSYRSQPTSEVKFPLKNEAQTPPRNLNSSSSDTTTKKSEPKRKADKPRRNDRSNCESEYNTGGESCDELEDDWDSSYPPIASDQQRQHYKREFDTDLQEYKKLQIDLDEIAKTIIQLDKDLDQYPENSKEYKAAAAEFNRLKEVKASADYRNKRKHCKELKNKLAHIKRMVSDYDNNKA
ncbi:occludin [Ambystoma mexicanum]|uniref:occludin n=1 Tax=Ambystoma mexicanum TaxID=8296 RepID=UPI0037E8CE05